MGIIFDTVKDYIDKSDAHEVNHLAGMLRIFLDNRSIQGVEMSYNAQKDFEKIISYCEEVSVIKLEEMFNSFADLSDIGGLED
jgi:hypothetical protein